MSSCDRKKREVLAGRPNEPLPPNIFGNSSGKEQRKTSKGCASPGLRSSCTEHCIPRQKRVWHYFSVWCPLELSRSLLVDRVSKTLPSLKFVWYESFQGRGSATYSKLLTWARHLTRSIYSKKIVRATRPPYLCASTKTMIILVQLSYWTRVLYLRSPATNQYLA